VVRIIKADLYRIFREPAFYITFGIMAGLFILVRGVGILGITIGGIPMNAQGTMLTNQFNGMQAPFVMMTLMDFLSYFLLAVVMFTAARDFSTNAVRGVLSTDVARTKYYVSKLFMAIMFCVALALFSVIVPTVIGSLAGGFGGELSSEYIISVLMPFGAQLFLLICLACVGVFLAITTKSSVATTGGFLAFVLVPDWIIQYYLDFATYRAGVLDAAAQYNEGLGRLSVFSIAGSIRNMLFAPDLPNETVILTLAIGAFYAVASTIAGILLFKRSGIK
jgi:ABC-type transport system involved in multi-copper enzyme maturation permease subunit